MKNITNLNTINNIKNSFCPPFPSKSTDLAKNIRVKGAEKQAVSLRNGPEKQAVSLNNGPEKQAVSLRNGLEKYAVRGCIYFKSAYFFPQPGSTRVYFFPYFISS